jgi:peroxin-13
MSEYLHFTSAMVSVAEQFGNLRNTLGSVLGIFTLLRWLRTLLAKLTGRPPPADATSLTPSAFASFMSGNNSNLTPTALPDGTPTPPRPSKKPFIMFLLAVFGLPYLMGKLIRALARSQEAEEARRQQEFSASNGQQLMPNNQQQAPHGPIDPSKLDFCRVLYDYNPPNQATGIDIPVKRGDLVAVLSKTDPMGNPSEWWRCRARDGKVGYLPSPYLETIQRRQGQGQGQITAGSAPGSRTATLRTLDSAASSGEEARTKSLSSVVGVNPGVGSGGGTGKGGGLKQQQQGGPELKGKMGDVSAESFQKSAFYS